MTSLPNTAPTDDDLDAAISQFADRCYELPPRKQQFLIGLLSKGPAIHVETFDILLQLLENSDDDFNITSPELNELITEAIQAHDNQEAQ